APRDLGLPLILCATIACQLVLPTATCCSATGVLIQKRNISASLRCGRFSPNGAPLRGATGAPGRVPWDGRYARASAYGKTTEPPGGVAFNAWVQQSKLDFTLEREPPSATLSKARMQRGGSRATSAPMSVGAGYVPAPAQGRRPCAVQTHIPS